MSNQQLDLADFILAYGYLIEVMDPEGERECMPEGPDNYDHHAGKVGRDIRGWYDPTKNPEPKGKGWMGYAGHALSQLRRMRGTDRLPRGVKALRQQLWDAMCKRVFRNCERNNIEMDYPRTGDPKDRMAELIAAKVIPKFTAAYPREATHKKNYDNEWVPREVDLKIRKRRPRLKWGTVSYESHQLFLRPNYYGAVMTPGLVVVEETFILDASPVRDFDLPMGIESAWRVLRLVCEGKKNFAWYAEPALVVVHERDPDKLPRFAPDESATFGWLAGAAKSTAYKKARRKVR